MMNQENVSILSSERELLPVGPYGALGALKEESLVIRVKDGSMLGITVDGNKNVSVRRSFSTPDGETFCQQIVPIKMNGRGVRYTDCASNNLQLLEIGQGDGRQGQTNGQVEIYVWEIAITSQNGYFFLSIQKVYQSPCYRDDAGRVICSKISRWASLAELLSRVINHVDKLPHLNSAPLEEEKEIRVEDGRAIVLWWNNARQVGAIQTKKGAARVYWKEVIPRGGRAYLVAGEKIVFQTLRPLNQSQRQTDRTTSFRWEAFGVTFSS